MEKNFLMDLGVSEFTAEIIVGELEEETRELVESLSVLETELLAERELRTREKTEFEERLDKEKKANELSQAFIKAGCKNVAAAMAVFPEGGSLEDIESFVSEVPYLFDEKRELFIGASPHKAKENQAAKEPEKMDFESYKRWRSARL